MQTEIFVRTRAGYKRDIQHAAYQVAMIFMTFALRLSNDEMQLAVVWLPSAFSVKKKKKTSTRLKER